MEQDHRPGYVEGLFLENFSNEVSGAVRLADWLLSWSILLRRKRQNNHEKYVFNSGGNAGSARVGRKIPPGWNVKIIIWIWEYLACVKDILDHKVFQSMDNYMQHGDTTCKAHCIKVSYLSYCICRKFGWEYKEAARAGLLHDFFLYDWHTHARETGERFHGFTHPRAALKNAVKHFDLTENEKKHDPAAYVAADHRFRQEQKAEW